MPNFPADDVVVPEVETLRIALPTWIVSTVELVELAENAERAATASNPHTADRSRKLIVEIAEWQQKLSEWQNLALSPRLSQNFAFSKPHWMRRWMRQMLQPPS